MVAQLEYRLPTNDGWLLVLQHGVDINGLMSLWKVSRSMRTLINKHEEQICTRVAHNTFPAHIVQRLKKTPNEVACLEWLEDLIPRFLASAVVDRVRFRSVDSPPRYVRCGIAAADHQGDVLRERVADGWRIALRLSSVLKAAERDPKHTLNRKPKNFRSRLPEMHVREFIAAGREKARERRDFDTPIFKIVRRFFGGVTWAELYNFRLLNWYLAESISRLAMADELRSEKFQASAGVTMREVEYWLLWKMCRDGPQLYWNQWWVRRDDRAAHPLSRAVVGELRTSSPDKIKLDVQLGTAIRHLARPSGLPQSATDAIGYMKSFCENAYRAPASETSLADPYMEHLAYRADSKPYMDEPATTYCHAESNTRMAAFCCWE